MKNQKSNVMTKAWEVAKTLKVTISEALKSAWKAVKKATMIEKAVAMAFFKITFAKKETGEITERVGSNARQKVDCLMFFSVTDNGFRMAILDNIISIVPVSVDYNVNEA